MKPKLFLLLIILALFLAACDAIGTGMEIKTTVRLDGSAVTIIGLGFIPEEDSEDSEIDCGEVEGLPPGATVELQRRGSEYWCVMTVPTSTVQELKDMFISFGEDFFKINCLHFVDNIFVYDADLFYGVDASATEDIGDIVILWELTVPGDINSHNAHTQNEGTLSWSWPAASIPAAAPINIRINVEEGKGCPSTAVDLKVFIQEDGSGWADFVMPIPLADEDLTAPLQGDLERMGWTISSVDAPYDGPGQIKATREYNSNEGFNQIIQSVPGLAGSQASMNLELLEDEESGLRVAEFRAAAWDMNAYAAYWESLAENTAVPAFEFQIDAPGLHEKQSGKWTNPDILLTEWDTDDPTRVISLSFRSVWDSDRGPYTKEDVADQLEALIDRFLVETPAGQVVTNPSFIQNGLAGTFPAGWVNNWTGGGFACGDYQTIVLNWLDSIRRSPDPQMRVQLKGLDYGPIQAYSGGHQAVVVFPRGTDWKETGTVLDPWPTQIPATYEIEDWVNRFPRGVGAGQGAENYPHIYGGSPIYKNNPLPENARLHTRQIGVNSPVNVLVVAADGRRLGMLEDGSLINEIPNADFYPTPKGDGTTHWQFGLPPGEYEVVITGTGEGKYHLMVGDGQGNIFKYDPQSIAPGGQVRLPVNQESLEQPMTTAAGQEVMPIQVTEDNLDQIDFGSPIVETDPGAVVEADLGSEAASADGSSAEVPSGESDSTNTVSSGPLDSAGRGQVIAAAAGIFLGFLCFLVLLAAGGFLIYRYVRGR